MSSSKYNIRAIDTEYNGYFFRSRLEARWSIFFEKAGIKYRYEPEGVNLDGVRYLPDFFLPELNFWVEVKPDKPTEQERDKAVRLCVASRQSVVILAGEVWDDVDCFCYLPTQTDVAKAGLEKLKMTDEESIWWMSASQFIYTQGEVFGADLERNYIWGYTYFGQCSGCGKIGLYMHIWTNACGCKDNKVMYDTPELKQAYTAARQARFEHGMKGKGAS